jgi:hypothetical protein
VIEQKTQPRLAADYLAALAEADAREAVAFAATT